jgi:hypothetical protein
MGSMQTERGASQCTRRARARARNSVAIKSMSHDDPTAMSLAHIQGTHTHSSSQRPGSGS